MNQASLIESLQAEIEYLRGELGQLVADDDVVKIASIGFSPSEARTVLALWRRKGVMNRDALFDAVPHKSDDTESRIAMVYISRIRARLGYDSIQTVYGVGYKLTPEGRARVDEIMGRQS